MRGYVCGKGMLSIADLLQHCPVNTFAAVIISEVHVKS